MFDLFTLPEIIKIKRAIVLLTDLLVELNEKPKQYKELKEIVSDFEKERLNFEKALKKFNKTKKF